jgi:hypothetical protein
MALLSPFVLLIDHFSSLSPHGLGLPTLGASQSNATMDLFCRPQISSSNHVLRTPFPTTAWTVLPEYKM